MNSSRGFTLIEMAIVMLIIGLLIATAINPIATQIEERRVADTKKVLEQVKDALIGYALVNGRLPGPATSATNGTAIASCGGNETTCTGFIPWQTLGVSQVDAWGKIIRYSVTPAFVDSNIALTSAGTKTIQTRQPPTPATPVTLVSGAPAVIFSHGSANHGTSELGTAMTDGSTTNTDEDANNTATVTFMTRDLTTNPNASGGEFDDVLTWLSSSILFSRMAQANKF